jgi:hypothetical protein
MSITQQWKSGYLVVGGGVGICLQLKVRVKLEETIG